MLKIEPDSNFGKSDPEVSHFPIKENHSGGFHCAIKVEIYCGFINNSILRF